MAAQGGAYALTSAPRPSSGGVSPAARPVGARKPPAKAQAPPKPSGGVSPAARPVGAQRPPVKPQAPQKQNRPKPPPPVNPLAPLSSQQIRQQAAKTVGAAYKPNLQDLNSQRTQAANLYRTQQADAQAFQKWLTGTAATMQSATDTVNQKLTDVLTNIRQQQSAALGGAAQAASQQQAASGAATPQAQLQQGLTNATQPTIDAANAHTATADIRQAESAMGGNNLMAGATQVAQGRIAQVNAAQLDSLNKTVNSIAQERTKLITARTGDIAKEIARLNGIEISKAQYNQNQSALREKLGISAAVATTGRINAATNQQKAVIAGLVQKETARHNAQNELIASTHYATQAQHDAAVAAENHRHNAASEAITSKHNAATEAIGRSNAASNATRAGNAGTGAAKGKNKAGVAYATPQAQRAVSTYINTLRTAIQGIMQQYGRTADRAYHDILHGNLAVPRPPLGYSDSKPFLNIALNSLTGAGEPGLSQGDVDFLQSIGMPDTFGYAVHRPAPMPRTQGGRPAGA